jgi:hypothetical protein
MKSKCRVKTSEEGRAEDCIRETNDDTSIGKHNLVEAAFAVILTTGLNNGTEIAGLIISE